MTAVSHFAIFLSPLCFVECNGLKLTHNAAQALRIMHLLYQWRIFPVSHCLSISWNQMEYGASVGIFPQTVQIPNIYILTATTLAATPIFHVNIYHPPMWHLFWQRGQIAQWSSAAMPYALKTQMKRIHAAMQTGTHEWINMKKQADYTARTKTRTQSDTQ